MLKTYRSFPISSAQNPSGQSIRVKVGKCREDDHRYSRNENLRTLVIYGIAIR
jgi:hypothetical protein